MDLDYNTRLAAIQRNEKLAQIMQQQAFQPIDIQSYQGIQAPISPLSGLAKVLQAYMGAKGTGEDERIKLNQEAKVQAQQMLSGLQDRPASPGRAAVMGMPEIQARPATSFTPMGADFEDNPNLQTAPSGNVETPAVAYQPAVAAQAAIAPQPAMQLTQDQKRQKYVEIMMGQNPYASPVAKLMYEQLGKQESGPLAKYNLYVEQTKANGGKPLSIDEFETRQKIAGATRVTNNIPSSMAPMFVRDRTTGKTLYVQADSRGNFDLSRYEPIEKGTDLRQKLADAGIFPNLPDGSVNPEYTKYARAALAKDTTITVAPSSSSTDVEGTTTIAAPIPEKGTVNVIIDGKVKAIPIEDFNKLNAARIGSETRASENVKNEYDFETVPDPKGSGAKVLMSKTEIARLAALGTPVVSEVDKKAQQGISVIELAEKAKGLLPSASSGALSTLATIATDAAGYATNKSAADASLKVIAAGLTSNVPRFEGPQGVLDVKLYEKAAADVGNPLIPYRNRIAALNTVIELNQKYLPVGAAPSGAVRRITPRTGQQ